MMHQSPESCWRRSAWRTHAGAFVFPMHEPDGYRAANDTVIAAAAAPTGCWSLLPRGPEQRRGAEARRALAAGARGIKLHPRAESSRSITLRSGSCSRSPTNRTLPILTHAGRGIPALGEHAVELATTSRAHALILAHAGITDLSWIWRVAADLPNLMFDTAWWMPADLLALFSLVPPGQVLFASDMPYGHTLASAAAQLRLMLQAGLTHDQIRASPPTSRSGSRPGEPLEQPGTGSRRARPGRTRAA